MFEFIAACLVHVMLTLIRACWDGCYLVPKDLWAVFLASVASMTVVYCVWRLLGHAYARWQRGRQ